MSVSVLRGGLTCVLRGGLTCVLRGGLQSRSEDTENHPLSSQSLSTREWPGGGAERGAGIGRGIGVIGWN